ncbi:hypothetical protein D779_1677 [Imhoffiella purpurea]|uniref:Uncharacterized protein n=1 Tax=Imhoffiella purpurea TaxID=1249627 RepID=W9V6C9_9GAMM|nr:hypothetical protein D779_1677 [Imhoffiella purpurea]
MGGSVVHILPRLTCSRLTSQNPRLSECLFFDLTLCNRRYSCRSSMLCLGPHEILAIRSFMPRLRITHRLIHRFVLGIRWVLKAAARLIIVSK